MNTSGTTKEEAEKLNLNSAEFDLILKLLGREPNELELEIISLMWSEHASYKSSWKWISQMPSSAPHVLVEAGKESAGAIDLGNGLACVFKIESHNHPCAIQPKLGAATGLRVVSRDLIAMGAKPLAFLSSLRLGDGHRDTARWLFKEVTNGLCEFEKGYGVPVIAGETYFDKEYNSSPVINSMAIGVTNTKKLASGICHGEGNLLVLLGSATGLDGVDEDVFEADAAAKVDAKHVLLTEMMDVTVEKSLQSVIHKLIEHDLCLGIQVVGAQGIIGAAAEMTARGGQGVRIDLEKVPCVKQGMSNKEVLLSQTMGRVLVCVSPKKLAKIEPIATKLGLEVAAIGEVVKGDMITCYNKNKVVCALPASYLGLGGNAPQNEPAYFDVKPNLKSISINDFDEPDHYPDVIKIMLTNLNITSKEWLMKKFDATLKKDGASETFPSDAAFIELDGVRQSLAVTLDCNSSYMKSDPFVGAQIAVAEAARNIVCGGGIPLGLSDCLNFGNPYNEEVYSSFVQSVKGISKASVDFNIPVISGNVSFYNQRSEEGKLVPIVPTPVIGMVGLVEDKKNHCTLSFRHKGDMIFLIGRSRDDVNSSEYASTILKIEESAAPYYKVEEELEVQAVVINLIKQNLVRSVHDVSNGGLFFTLLECAIPMEYGFDITSDAEIRKDAFLFGESQSRIVVSVSPAKQDDFVDLMIESEVPFSILGHVTKGELRVDDEAYGFISDLKKEFEANLSRWVEEK